MKSTQLIQAGAILAALAALQSVAAAQQPVRANERYCLEASGGRGGGTQPFLCRFETMDQCIASKIAQGNRCFLNPWLAFQQQK
jgi:hypothetical protein